ncbi:hypothetical protein ACYSNW_00265 [Enterococcus sp. LJL99]
MKKEKRVEKVKVGLAFSVLFVLLFMLWTDISAYAEEGQPVGTPIKTATEWNNAMKDTTGVDYYVAVPELKITTTSEVSTNKHIDLNGNTVNFVGDKSAVKMVGYEKHTDFTIFSSSKEQGVLKSSGHDTTDPNVNPFMGFIRDARPDKDSNGKNDKYSNLSDNGQNSNLVVTFKNIKVDSKDEFTYLMWTKEVVFKGKISIHTEFKGVIAANITLYGNEDDPNDPDNAVVRSTTGTNRGDAGFGRGYGPANFLLATEPGYDILDRREADEHRFLIKKNAELYAENNGIDTGTLNHSIILHFRHFENNGVFKAKCFNSGNVLRSNMGNVDNDKRGSINLNSDSVTEIATTSKYAQYGMIGVYRTDVNVDSPRKFDFRYFGTGAFFRIHNGWNSESDFNVKNMNHAVWSKGSKGIGNPIRIWQSVDTFTLEGVTVNKDGSSNSSNADMAKNFSINNYSRWSNDIDLPELIMTDKATFNQSEKYYVMPNNEKLDGLTRYKLPDGSYVENRVAEDAELVLTLGSKRYVTNADAEGKWSFDNLDLSKIAGGTKGTLVLTDTDLRTDKVSIQIVDKTPPTAIVKKLTTYKGKIAAASDTTGIPSYVPSAFSSYEDETSAKNKIVSQWVTTDAEKNKLVETVGLKDGSNGTDKLVASLKDEAGNVAEFTIPLLVIDENDSIGNTGSVHGIDFEVDIREWSAETARTIVIDKGEARGYSLSASTITDVTNDANKFTITTTAVKDKINVRYPITLACGDASKTIYVTFTDTEPPKAKSKVTSVSLNDSDAIKKGDLKSFLTDVSDNVTPVDKILAELVTGQEIEELVSTTGIKELQIKLTDEAGNSDIFTTEILVYDDSWTVTKDTAITGQNFEMDQIEWTSETERELTIAYGNVLAYDIAGEKAIDITANAAEFNIDTSSVETKQVQAYRIILTAGTAEKVITLTFKDTLPPEGIGKITVIDLNDKEAIENVSDYSVFLSEWSDNVTEKADIKITLAPGQDIAQIVSVVGKSSFTLNLIDEAGNVGEVVVPIFVKELEDEVSKTHLNVLGANDFSVAAIDYPTDEQGITQMILEKSEAALYDTVTGEKLDLAEVEIDKETLPAPNTGSTIAPSGIYEVTLYYGTGDSKVAKKIMITVVKSISNVTVKFVNEQSKDLKPGIILEGMIGDGIDLTKNKDIEKMIELIKQENFVLKTRPENETNVIIEKDGTVVEYRFEGIVFLSSTPDKLDFGLETSSASNVRVDEVTLDKSLIVSDTRATKKEWYLSAKVIEDFKAIDGSEKTLSGILRYNDGTSNEKIFTAGTTHLLLSKTSDPSDSLKVDYDVSDLWQVNGMGFKLEVPGDHVKKVGKYQATIEFMLSNTP